MITPPLGKYTHLPKIYLTSPQLSKERVPFFSFNINLKKSNLVLNPPPLDIKIFLKEILKLSELKICHSCIKETHFVPYFHCLHSLWRDSLNKITYKKYKFGVNSPIFNLFRGPFLKPINKFMMYILPKFQLPCFYIVDMGAFEGTKLRRWKKNCWLKSPTYGRHRIPQPMRIVSPLPWNLSYIYIFIFWVGWPTFFWEESKVN